MTKCKTDLPFVLGQRVRVLASIECTKVWRGTGALVAGHDSPGPPGAQYRRMYRYTQLPAPEGIIIGYRYRQTGRVEYDEEFGAYFAPQNRRRLWLVAATLHNLPLEALQEDIEAL